MSDDGSAAARRFHERVRNPLLTDISIDWGGLPVADVYPAAIPDLFGAKPVVLTGRFTGAARGTIRLKGRAGSNAFEREMAVTFPESQAEHDVLATLWARRRVEAFMSQDYEGAQTGRMRDDLREAVTNLGLEYGLMTPFTSFVAVEEMTFTDGGEPRRVDVPVEMPEGTGGLPGGFQTSSDPNGFLFQFFAGRRSVNANAAYINTTNGSLSGTLSTQQLMTLPTNGRAPTLSPNAKPEVSAAKIEAEASAEVVRVGGDAPPRDPEKAKEMEREVALRTKLHASLYAIVGRLKKPDEKPGPDELKLVREGKAEVQIWLNEKTPEVLAQLKALGFELLLDPQSAKLVIGRVPVEKLSALVEIKAVRYVAPQK